MKSLLLYFLQIPLEKQLPFLHVFLPLTLSYIPTSLNLFIKWIIGKVYQLEMKYPKQFPENAIEFIKKMELLLKNDANTSINFQQQNAIDQKYFQQLTEVYQALERLQILKSEYRVIISFQQYLHVSTHTYLKSVWYVPIFPLLYLFFSKKKPLLKCY